MCGFCSEHTGRVSSTMLRGANTANSLTGLLELRLVTTAVGLLHEQLM